MTRKRRRGYVFETYSGDHPPLHVHIYQEGREIGRWDIEHQTPMDDFEVSQTLRRALGELGYLVEEGDGHENKTSER